MEIKSRYEVISDLERQKRDLIQTRDGFKDELIEKQKELTETERTKSDQIVAWDRKIADLKKGIETFKKTIEEKKTTTIELIKSVEDSLNRFSKIQDKK